MPDLATCLDYFRDILVSGSADRELLDHEGVVVGTFCNFVPEELVWAVGGRSIRLCGGRVDWEDAGEQVVSREVCSAVKSAAALPAMNPELWERLDLVVIPASCDGKKKLADVLARSKPVHVMDVPSTRGSATSQQNWRREVERLAARIEKLAERKIGREGLDRVARMSERREEQFRRLLELRHQSSGGGALLLGEEFLFVANASFMDEPERYTDNLEALVAAAELGREGGFSRVPSGTLRIMLAGAPLIYPNYKLLRVIESAGAVVVADDSCAGTHRLYLHLAPRDSSRRSLLEALADRTLLPSMCPCFCASDDRVARVKELIRLSSADGVIYHQLHNCTLFAVDAHVLQPELQREGIPVLVIDTDQGPSDVDQITTRVEAFLEMLAGSVGPQKG